MKKILIISDTHGRHVYLEELLRKIKPIELLIHLGDVCGQADYIEALADCPVEMIAGNNDIFSRLDRAKDIKLGKYKVHMEHGHRLSYVREYIRDDARQLGADIIMYGHTHEPVIDLTGDIWLINPGSISLPRQEGRRPSYIIMELDDKGEAHFTLNYM